MGRGLLNTVQQSYGTNLIVNSKILVVLSFFKKQLKQYMLSNTFTSFIPNTWQNDITRNKKLHYVASVSSG